MNTMVDRKQLNEAMTKAPSDRQSAALDAARAKTRRTQALLAAAGESCAEPHWHAVTVRERSERAVGNALFDAGFSYWFPTEQRRYRRRTGAAGERTIEVLRPAFPGYVFLRMTWTAAACHWLQTLDGVAGMVGGWIAPTIVREAEFTEFKGFFDLTPRERDRIAADKLRARLGIGEGDQVVISDGPMVGYPGVVVEECDAISMYVEIALFGRMASVKVDLANLTKRG